MARIKIELPSQFIYQTEIPVRITDLNYGGHMGNDVLLSMLHEARMQWFASLGYPSEVAIEGVGVIMTDAALVYKAETFYGETLQIHLALTDFNKYGFDVVYKIMGKQSAKEIAHAKTGLVFFDYSARKISPIPPPFLQKVKD
ncbi:thioesterase family protein [Cytophagales bacterium LB-30]|uniref:Thioesterase family protein n=1 Tax=Shiella aurantiaca TaxID=3058365 RepID=A0ABT8F2X8_9BACT|nr:thioesterase family protein [Shiella aurantiaca]MDN4164658.1 thioesterase family protein [Shiella aurantiaca]